MHEVEIQGIADGEVAKGIVGYNPIISGQLTREEIYLSSEDNNRPLNLKTNEYDAITNHCIPKTVQSIERKEISIPARRNSTFEIIEHKPEGYLEGGWKSESTRLNQIRFYNQVINNKSNLTTDGLSTLKYTKVSSTSQGKYSFISVKL